MTFRDENNFPELYESIDEGMENALTSLAVATNEQIHEGFDFGQDALGNDWKPLKEETIRAKGSSKILIDKGDMRDSVTYEVDEEQLEARVGSNSDILPYHEFGVPENNLPRRAVLGPGAVWAEKNIDDEFGDVMAIELEGAVLDG